MDFVLRQTANGWRVVDVLADGSISQIAVLRSDFRGLLADGTGAALLASLEKKVADLSVGSAA
jgi:phospholipid transport system substrate-binding protein